MTNKIQMRPRFSICIPAYNRAALLVPLLESILHQQADDIEVLICEDKSPERKAIADVVRTFQDRFPGCIRYHENEVNLGYDGNLRQLVRLARGEFCLFMGNDDLMCPGALQAVRSVIDRNPGCGVVVRTYASFDISPDQPKQVFRYFPQEHVIAAGSQAICTAYRRSVVISGMVIHRDAAEALHTNTHDGSLLYQLYLVGRILAQRSVVFVPDVIALRRDGVPPDFGNSEAERGKFVPHDQTPDSSLHFMRGMLAIARQVELDTQLKVFAAIRADIGHYSYPILSIQARRPAGVFLSYSIRLAALGFWRYPLFYAYGLALLMAGPDRTDQLIASIKRRLGHTPRFGTARTRHP